MVRIRIKEGKDPQLKIPQFICDRVLKEGVPSPYHLMVNGYKFMLWVGRPAAGKTSHMMSLFKDKRCFRKLWNNIILCCPAESLNSLKEGSNIFKDICPSKMYDSIDDIDVIREQVKFFAAHDENSVIIIDDQMSRLKNPVVEGVLCDIVANRRHYRCSIILLSQIYERVPLKVRKLVNSVVVMYRPSKKEMAMMFDELLEQKEEVAEQIEKLTFKKPYDWMLLDVPSQSIFAKYDQLCIEEDAKEETQQGGS